MRKAEISYTVSGTSPPLSIKACTNCGAKKPSTEFYLKGVRLDSYCKDCKKNKRRKAYKHGNEADSQIASSYSSQPKMLIEPSPVPSKGCDSTVIQGIEEPKALIEPENNSVKSVADGIDYSLWERLYGRVLTDAERIEIKVNLRDFFLCLMSWKNGIGEYDDKN